MSIKEKMAQKQVQASKLVLNNLVDSFSSPEKLEDAVIKTFLEPIDVPQNAYSRMNRILLAVQGSFDARGSSAWRKLDRFPVNWSKQVFIMMPKTTTIKDKETDEDIVITTGFFLKGLYDAENTSGGHVSKRKMVYVTNPPKELPPLADVAEKWGVEINYKVNPSAYGSFDQAKNEILLSTDNAGTFFHELAHKAHQKIVGKLKGSQDPQQEAIAQLVSGVLCRMYNQKMDKYTYDYICKLCTKRSSKSHAVDRQSLKHDRSSFRIDTRKYRL